MLIGNRGHWTDMFRNFNASCSCGSLGYQFSTAISPIQWQVRKCTCSFCSGHQNHLHVSDSLGQVVFKVSVLAHLVRHRFSTKTADFLMCVNCNSYLGAVMTTPRGSFAVINAEIINLKVKLAEPILVSFDNETTKQRVIRRTQNWTPVLNDKLFF